MDIAKKTLDWRFSVAKPEQQLAVAIEVYDSCHRIPCIAS